MTARHTNYVPALTHPCNTKIAAYTHGRVNDQPIDILLDSGASCSVISRNHTSHLKWFAAGHTRLITADGRSFSPLGTTSAHVDLGILKVTHTFVVVDTLSVSVILGCDFLRAQNLILDFQKSAFYSAKNPYRQGKLCSQLCSHIPSPQSCTLVLDDDCPQAVPLKVKPSQQTLEMPTDYHPALSQVLQDHEQLFKQELGKTNVTQHVIDTGDATPVKVPPRPIPFHYVDRVHKQLQEMAEEGIIQPSNSPWCSPAVYVPKNNGEIRICIDFVQLNKVTKKDSYPVPRADGPHQKLANKAVFSKLDLKSAYWQFPMCDDSIEKTAFCPGPGYGLWEFTVMPFGLTGATQTCQRGLDMVLKDCRDCSDNYIDDCIVFSDNMESHVEDLRRVLGRLQAAGFTLRGSKCFFGKTSISHLGFEYSSSGVTPTTEKIDSIAQWPTPTSPKEVRSFLGLVNFYRRFIPKFSDLAAPLNKLTGSKVTFHWQKEHDDAFLALKEALSSPPLLDYPRHGDQFILATDASDVGLGAVLSTKRGPVIEFASRTLTSAEKNYSTTEKECLAIVWAAKKFRHYLIGAKFILETDHKPLEWLESAKKESELFTALRTLVIGITCL